MNILLSGSSGKIGTELLQILRLKGHNVRLLERTPKNEDPNSVGWTLGLDPDPSVFENIEILIHLAWVTNSRNSESQHLNIGGSAKLFEMANIAKVKVIFISSYAANHPSSIYGKAKLKVENYNTNGVNIRIPFIVESENSQHSLERPIKNLIKMTLSSKSIYVQISEKREACLAIEAALSFEGNLLTLDSRIISFTELLNKHLGIKTIEVKIEYINLFMNVLKNIKSAKINVIYDRWVSLITSSNAISGS
jgi:hypothetical protein